MFLFQSTEPLTFFANACVGSPEIVAVDGVGRDTRLLFHALIFVKSAGVALDAGLAHASVRSGEILASVGPSGDGVADAFGTWSIVATFYAFIDIRGAGSAFPAYCGRKRANQGNQYKVTSLDMYD